MDIEGLLLLITTGVNFGPAFFILLKNWRNKINVWFAATLFLIAVWSFCMAMFRASFEPRLIRMWSDLYYLMAALIALTFFYFTHSFPVEIKKLSRFVHVTALAVTIILVFIIFSEGIVGDIRRSASYGHDVAIHPMNYFLYCVYFFGFLAVSFIHLRKKMVLIPAFTKKVVEIVFYATLLSAIAGSVFDLMLPLFGNYRLIWIGPLFTIVMVFIIVRYVFIKEIQ